MRQAFIGIDVGTSSARAGIFDESGILLATARHPITVWHEAGGVVEQSSSEIWAACAAAVRAAMAEAAIPPSAVKGLGFDATCSLVVLDAAGGPATFGAAGHFFDLADYLSFRATGSTARSVCTLGCKWNYLAREQRWSASYFERIGLGDLASGGYAKIGNEIVAAGTPLATGLAADAARDFGLIEGTPVGASLIDAHAGGVGTIGGSGAPGEAVDVRRRLAYIMGTSACIMATTSEPRFVPGVWGPYYSGMIPGFWLNEGGQSAAGAAIDHLIRSHPAYPETVAAARAAGVEILEYLERRII